MLRSRTVWHRTYDTIHAEGDTHWMKRMTDVTSAELHQLLAPPVTSAQAAFLLPTTTIFIQSFVKHIKHHSPSYY